MNFVHCGTLDVSTFQLTTINLANWWWNTEKKICLIIFRLKWKIHQVFYSIEVYIFLFIYLCIQLPFKTRFISIFSIEPYLISVFPSFFIDFDWCMPAWAEMTTTNYLTNASMWRYHTYVRGFIILIKRNFTIILVHVRRHLEPSSSSNMTIRVVQKNQPLFTGWFAAACTTRIRYCDWYLSRLFIFQCMYERDWWRFVGNNSLLFWK